MSFHPLQIMKRKPSMLIPTAIAGTASAAVLYAIQMERKVEQKYEEAQRNYGLENNPLAIMTSNSLKCSLPSDHKKQTEYEALFIPRHYDKHAIEHFWRARPITVFFRVSDVLSEMLPIFISYIQDFHIKPFMNKNNTETLPQKPSSVDLQYHHAKKLRNALTRLGPAFVKGGQQLSIRPDLVPPPVLRELQQLCDSVTPVEDHIAMKVLSDELRLNHAQELSHLFKDMRLVASASLGQVYKASLADTNESVAIKVQRPDMVRKVSLDLFLLHKLAKAMDIFTGIFTKQAPYYEDLVDTFAEGSYLELDYENEAANQIKFKEEFAKRRSTVFIPSVFHQFTSRRVLVTEWVEGVKLADAPQSLIQKLIPIGVELFLIQLLDIGSFHADPHPGNLYVTDGKLCLLDFGLVAKIDPKQKKNLCAAIVHLLIGDFDSLISEDAKKLGFLPDYLDTSDIQPILKTILTQGLLESGSNLHKRKNKLIEISSELNEVFFRYPFSVPPFFALITRGLGLLEGIALSGDPDFDIFKASYPYARRRAVEIFGQHGINQMKRRMTVKAQASDSTIQP